MITAQPTDSTVWVLTNPTCPVKRQPCYDPYVRFLLCCTVLLLAACPAPSTSKEGSAPKDAPVPSAARSQPAAATSQPSGDAHNAPPAEDFKVPDLAPLSPLEGPPAGAVGRWTASNAPESCVVRMREVSATTAEGKATVAYQLLVTYEVNARTVEDATAYTVKVRHIRAKGRREDYKTKLDSSRSGDMLRVTGGADTTVLFDVVFPFALLDRTIEIVMAPDGTLRKVTGGDDVREAMMQLHPPKPRRSPYYKGRVDALMSDARLAAYLLPMVGVTATTEPHRSARDDADYAVELLTNGRARPVGAAVLWEQKQAFAPSGTSPSAPPLGDDTSLALVSGQRAVTVEQQPGRACFRQAGSSETRTERWTGVIEEAPVTVERKQERTRLWVRDETSASN